MSFKLACLFLALFNVASSASPESRISGGTPTTIQEFPYIVSITYHYPSIGLTLQRCVGSLISSWHVLTTAFCFTGANIDNMRVRAGSTNSLSGGILVPVQSFVRHPEYVASPRAADIAVMFLANPLLITGDVNVLLIPAPGTNIPDGQLVKVVSWGFESEEPGSLQLTTLKSIMLSKLPLDECKVTFEDSESVNIDESVICASSKGKGTCRGDSGAPAVIGDVLVGLASYYESCDSDDYPDVFTRIDKHTEWIIQVAVAPVGGRPVRTAIIVQ